MSTRDKPVPPASALRFHGGSSVVVRNKESKESSYVIEKPPPELWQSKLGLSLAPSANNTTTAISSASLGVSSAAEGTEHVYKEKMSYEDYKAQFERQRGRAQDGDVKYLTGSKGARPGSSNPWQRDQHDLRGASDELWHFMTQDPRKKKNKYWHLQ